MAFQRWKSNIELLRIVAMAMIVVMAMIETTYTGKGRVSPKYLPNSTYY